MSSTTILEFKIKGKKQQFVAIEEAIRTALFVRNKCIRLWMEGKSISQYDLSAYCKVLAAEYKFADDLNSMARQAAAERAWAAIKRFFDNCKAKIPGKKGYPQFRKHGRSVEYKTSGWKLSENRKTITFTDKKRIGSFKLIGTYDLNYYQIDQIKRVRLVRRADGYYCQFVIQIDAPKIDSEPTNRAIGLDVGLASFYTDSTGYAEPNPNFYRKGERRLRKLQRRLSRKYSKERKRNKQQQSSNYHKARNRVARQHLKISRQREEHAKRVARCVIQSNDLVAYEDLKVRNLVKNHCLAKSINDAGWYQFRQWLERFGQKMGKVTVAVPPHYTSQECSNCGTIVKKSLSTRTHKCACGCELDRDFNAAINILKRGLSTVGHTGTWWDDPLNAWGEGTATCVEETQHGQVRSANQESPCMTTGECQNELDFKTVILRLTSMPRRNDLHKILLLGSGPIVIGQGCEFDYSGTQACKALREEGYEVVLVNSNPATIMTDPETADRTYIEPLIAEMVEKVIAKERPDALLPTMGGQTALNLAVTLAENGVLEKYGVELIGAKLPAIKKAEDRLLFKEAMQKIGVAVCPSGIATNLDEAKAIAQQIGSYPLIIRPAFTLGGTGGGIAYNQEEFEEMAQGGVDASPVSQILVEQSLLGWKEYELEVMRDLADNVVIICSIENIDPMGIHTGDSITVAPAQTLTDKEYQRLRDASIKIIREIGVETGGSNIQFAVNPLNGDMIVIEMNPRVSRSSALASKATGFPIAKFAAKLAVGYTLNEIPNDITKKTPASFEPTIDYVVTKIPRFAFEKFPGSQSTLTTQMKSVGEAMAIGRTFAESFQKALRSLETGRAGWGCDRSEQLPAFDQVRAGLRTPNPERIFTVRHALLLGMSLEEIYELTNIDPWFLHKMEEILLTEKFLKRTPLKDLTHEQMWEIKRQGFSDRQIAFATKTKEDEVRLYRKQLGVVPVYKLVDTCAAEFEAMTPYYYSTYEEESEVLPSSKRKVMILGGGPNRIGQGIEFDYCCCHASYSLRKEGFETIMVNSNPETVSTDYDTSDRLYFEPLTKEDVLNIIEAETPEGIIVQFGGQTPLKLALPLQEYLNSSLAENPGQITKIWGTSPESIDIAENRERFEKILRELDIKQPVNGMARSYEDAQIVARQIGYPVVVRPSYVLGGRAMEIVYSDTELERYMRYAVQVEPDHPILVDKFLENAIEVDVDAIADQTGRVVIGGIMEHIEQAGIHSGDSACSLPYVSLSNSVLDTIRTWTVQLAKALKVIGLMNIQFAIQGEQVYIIEANPRASRTVPFVAKATGVPLAAIASQIMSGKTLESLGFTQEVIPSHIAVKEAVLPFEKFPGSDTILGPEMRSTGEVMGIDMDFGQAFAKASLAAGQRLPLSGSVFVSMSDRDKVSVVPVVQDLIQLGFHIVATEGTRKVLKQHGLDIELVLKLHEGRPHVVDSIKNQKIQLIITTPSGDRSDAADGRTIRRTALSYKIPLVTTISGAKATTAAIRSLQSKPLEVKALQEYIS